MRRRLGLPISIDGPDPHGHRRLAESLGGQTNARHTAIVCAWRQVFTEAGGEVPDRNVERMLSTTHVPVPDGDQRRMDLVVPGLNVSRGRPLFCDITVLSPVTRAGRARPGTSNAGGNEFVHAERENDRIYSPVLESGLGSLHLLGQEVYGRMSRHCVELLPELAWEKASGVHFRLRRGTRFLICPDGRACWR